MIPLQAANPGPFTGAGNWTYLVPGRASTLIDAGVGKPEHLELIAQHLPEGPTAVIVTHIHEDHAAGVVALAARWPQTKFYKFPWPERDTRYAVEWRPLRDGEVVGTGETSLEVVHTPGHSPDHICLWDAASRTLLCGDLVVKGSTVVIPASHGGSLVDYLQSLKRVAELNAARFLPAHGDVVDDPVALIRSYIQHRAEREQQVIDAVDHGAATIETITDRIYKNLAPPLIPMARESVLAHLKKLQQDKVFQEIDGRWQRLY